MTAVKTVPNWRPMAKRPDDSVPQEQPKLFEQWIEKGIERDYFSAQLSETDLPTYVSIRRQDSEAF